ncbi:MAG: branched-chain amino acid ABC transporter permease [Syntrophales bacterium]|nr:branched-chain amino acid ABC transporter permease [Syntrophales bacterium]
MESSAQIFQYILSGLANGSIYGIIGFGFAIIFNATGIINFAQGEFVMLGGMVTVFLLSLLQWPLVYCILLAILLTLIVGIIFERLAVNPLKDASPITIVIITIGASIFIRGIAMLVWGKDTYPLPSFSGDTAINLGGATIMPQHLWILGLTCIIIILNRLFFYHTIYGKAMRACSVNPKAAGLAGINVRAMVLISFAISSALGALAGIIIAPLTLTSYDVGIMLGLKGFCAAIIGGMGSGMGAVLGGFVLGILESLGAGLISAGYKDAIAFIVLLAILFFRPGGLLGRSGIERV